MKKLTNLLSLLVMLTMSVSVWADVYLTGTWDGWAHSGDLAKEVGGQVWLDLEANTTYEFKVYDNSTDKWYALTNGCMRDGNCTNWRMYKENDNCRFTTTFAGQYKFAIGWEDAGGSDGWVPTVTAIFPTVEPVATGELFGTYQQHDMPLFKENMTDPQKIGVDFYIATCGQHAVLRAISTGATTFNGDNWATQLRRVNAEGATQQEVQTCTNVSNKNHYTSGSCVRELNTTNEDIRFHFFVNGSYPAGVDGGFRKTTDFAFNRYSINNPIADDIAPVLDVENTTFVDNGDGTITVTFGDVTADDEYFYYVGDKDHNLGDISLDNTITLTKPTVQDGITYTLKAYAVDFNGNKSDAKEYSFTMPFDEELNLAENRPSYCGFQQQAGTGAEKANNTNPTDFWTCYGGPVADAWWKVDLVGTYDLNYIEMLWNDATGTYSIFGSTDDINWAPIVSGKAAPASQGTSTDEITASARYIKMQFSSSNIGLKNVIIRGTGIAAADHTAPTLSLSEVSKTVTTATIGLEYADLDDNGGAGQIVSIKISDTENGFDEREILSEISDGKITLSGLKDNTTYTFHVVVTDKAGNQTSKDLEVVLPFNTELNLAKNKPADAGVSQGDGVRAPKANNGDEGDFWTCYGTGTSDQWWWSVDLENLYQVNHIYILYNDHAGTYTLNYSADGTVWHEYQSGFSAQLVDEKYISNFTAPVVARYFKFVSTSANVGIREFEVYATGFAGADGTAPEIETFEATATTTNSVTLHIVATDKDDNEEIQPAPALTISDLANGLAEQAVVLDGDNKVVISGLKSNKTYNFHLTATDLAGNTTNDNLEVELPYDTDFDWTEYATEETVWAGYSNAGDTPINAVKESGHWGSYGITGENDEEKKAKNWWAIDLGAINEIRQITIDFEAERKYNVEYSFDDKAAADAGTATWLTAMANVDAGDADILNPNFAARMIRIHAQSASNMGIYRIHIKGSGWATTDAVAPQVTVTEVEAQKQTNSVVLHIVATDVDDAGVAHPVKSITISGDNAFTTIDNAVLDGEGNITLNGLKDNATYNFHVLVTDRVGLTASENITVRVAFNTAINLALNMPSEAGIHQDANVATRANDGNEGTMWTSFGQGTSDQWWWTVDLGQSFNINRVRILFNDHAGTYNLVTSDDGSEWINYATNFTIDNDHIDYTIHVVTSARYFKFTSTAANVGIKEFEVYGTGYNDGDTEKPQITAAALVGAAGEDEATISVTATDNVGVYACRFVDEANAYNQTFEYIAGEPIVVIGLVPGTEYTFSVVALDRAGNESDPFVMTSFSTTANDNVPHTAAPVPTIPAARVTSIYSDTYASAVKSGFQWNSWGGATEQTTGVIAGNNYVHYTGHADGQFGIGADFHDAETNAVGINISTRAALHVDVWSKEAYGQGIGITLNDNRLLLGYKLQAGWNSINVSLAELEGDNAADVLASLKWMKFTEITNKVIAIDNIYFYGVGISENADNTSNMENYGGQTVDIILNRAFTAGSLYTLCLPFDMSAAQVEEAFGTDAEVWKLVSSEDRGSLIHIDFALQSNIEAGVPYLFNPSKKFASGTAINNVVLKNTTGETVETRLFTMKGYVNPTDFIVADSYYFLAADKYLHTLGNDVTSPGLRSAFTITEGVDPAAARKPARVVLGTEVTTDMPAINAEVGVEKVMRNGQLYIIREGKMYNVQGQLVK